MPCFLKTFNVLIVVFISLNSAFAQNQMVIDSLLELVESDISGKKKVDIYVEIVQEYSRLDSINTEKYANKAMSLAKELQYPEGEIDALYQIGWNTLVSKNQTKAVEIFQRVIKRANNINYLKGKADGFNGLGVFYWQQNNYEKALESYLKSLEIKKKVGDKYNISKSMNNIGIVYQIQSNYEKALEYFFRALEIRKELGNKQSTVSRNYHLIGTIYSIQGNYSKALDYFYLALEINEESGDKFRLGTNYVNIGNVYLRLSDFEEALTHYFKSLKIFTNSGYKIGIAHNYNNIGTVYQRLKDFEKALDYQFKALKIREEIQDKHGKASTYNNIASAYEETGDDQKAIEYSMKSIELSNEIGLKVNKIDALLTMGKVYRKQGKWGVSHKNLLESFKYAKEIGSIEMLRDVAKEFALLESEIGNYKAAYEYQLFFKQMADSLQNEDLTKKITRLEMDYKFEHEKDSIQFANATQRVSLEKDIEQRKLVQLTTSLILALVLLLTLLLFIFFREKKRANILLSEKSKKLEEANKSLSESNYEVLQQAENITVLNRLLEKNLDDASKDLLVKNQKLAEYAFYNSHRTRAPLARVLGLLQLLDKNQVDKDTSEILELIIQCINDLDKTILAMNDILSDVDLYNDIEENNNKDNG